MRAGDRPRVHQPGMRRDQGDETTVDVHGVAIGCGEMPIDCGRQRRRRPRIPRACDGGLSDVHPSPQPLVPSPFRLAC